MGRGPIPEDLQAGTLAGDYRILAKLAEGGCGTIYQAQHQLLRRSAAIKVLHRRLVRSRTMHERFVREARATSQLRHPNIVDVSGFGRLEDGRPYYVMELLEGCDLDEHLEDHGRHTPREALAILEPVCSALQAAHDAGIVHRDLKASNVFLSRNREGKVVVKLLDFGIAKLLEPPAGDPALTRHDHRLGTPCAMSPEQITGSPVDGRADVYALGVLLYRLLTDSLPFHDNDPLVVQRLHLDAKPPRASATVPLAAALDAVVERALAKRPQDRHGSAIEFARELRRAVYPERPRTPARTALPAIAKGSPASNDAIAARAIALQIEARLAEDGRSEPDDATIDLMASALDCAERVALEAGFTVAVRTGWTILAAHILPESPEPELHLRQGALSLAISIQETLAVMVASNPRVRFSVCAHCDWANVRFGGGLPEIIGGRLLRLAAWSPPITYDSACATPDALAGLAEWATRRSFSLRSRFLPLRLPVA